MPDPHTCFHSSSKLPIIAVSVGLAVHHHLDGVLLHLRAQLRCDSVDACMVGLELISISQGLKSRPRMKSSAVQLEAVLAAAPRGPELPSWCW